MRDATDDRTAELDGIEPPPPPLPRPETFKQIKRRVSYYGPREAPACRHCKHRRSITTEPDTPFEGTVERCGLHGFKVELGAICSDWTAS